MSSPPAASLEGTLLDALERVGAAVLVLDSGKVSHANRPFCELVGLSAPEVHHLASIVQIVAPEDRARFAADLIERRSGEPRGARLDCSLVTPSGERVEVEIAVARQVHGGRGRDIFFVRDVTRIARTARALAQTRAHVEEMMAQAHFTLVELDATGRILHLEGSGLPLLHATAAILEGQNAVTYAEFFHPHTVPMLRRALAGEFVVEEVHVAGRDLACRMGPIRSASGEIERVVGVALDVTQMRSTQRDATVARSFVRWMMRSLFARGHPDHTAFAAAGREFAATMHVPDLDGYLREYEATGLGHLRLVARNGGEIEFEGQDLFEHRPQAHATTCHLALGFLCGAVSALASGARTVGSETECESRGSARCRFVIGTR